MTEPTEYLRVSYSSMNTFASCPRKFEFAKLYPKRDRAFEDFYAAEVGKAIHAAYQNFLTIGDKEQAIWTLMQEFPFELEFNQSNDYRGFDASLATLEEMMVDAKMMEYELARIMRPPTVSEVAEAAKLGLVAESTEVPAIEVPFELRFKGLKLPDGRGIAFTGFLDAILRNKSTGLYRTLDIKTSRVRMADATAKYKFDTQQVPYGIVVDHVAQDQVESFEVLYLDCYIDLVEPQVTFYPFMKSRQDIMEWATNRLIQFQQIQRFMESDYFPRTDSGCLFYQKPCAWLEPCMSRDKETLTEWFLLGEEPAKEEPFHPWIVADIDLGVN
jgi:ATP-dependent helicase/DNAse subunit B